MILMFRLIKIPKIIDIQVLPTWMIHKPVKMLEENMWQALEQLIELFRACDVGRPWNILKNCLMEMLGVESSILQSSLKGLNDGSYSLLARLNSI